MALNIKWNKRALRQLDDVVLYIQKENSPAVAEKVKKDILLKIDALLQHPELYTPDKYKVNNDGSYRAFEIHHYRISYYYKGNDIFIIRIRHTKMTPLHY